MNAHAHPNSSIEEATDNVLEHPPQIDRKHRRLIGNIGRVGFATKGLIYAMIGGLLIRSAAERRSETNQSPQGVFVLISSEPGSSGTVYLSLVLIGLLLYVIWRLAEGLTGQGYDSTFSKKKNFFKFRLAPLISAAVYISYAVYVITLLRQPKNAQGSTNNTQELSNTGGGSGACFPLCWRRTPAGTFGLVLLAIAFSIATLTQLALAVKTKFLAEMNKGKLQRTNRFVRWTVITIGRLGYLGRAFLFFAVAYFFWRLVAGTDPTLNDGQPTMSQALNGFTSASYAPYFMSIVGSLVLLYALFTLLSIYFRVFPTPPPSSNV